MPRRVIIHNHLPKRTKDSSGAFMGAQRKAPSARDTSPIEEGFQAAKAGKSLDDNPHPHGSVAANSWVKGYVQYHRLFPMSGSARDGENYEVKGTMKPKGSSSPITNTIKLAAQSAEMAKTAATTWWRNKGFTDISITQDPTPKFHMQDKR